MTDHAQNPRDPVARIAPPVLRQFYARAVATVLIEILISKLKALTTAGYAEVMPRRPITSRRRTGANACA